MANADAQATNSESTLAYLQRQNEQVGVVCQRAADLRDRARATCERAARLRAESRALLEASAGLKQTRPPRRLRSPG